MKKHIIYSLFSGILATALSCSSDQKTPTHVDSVTPVKVTVSEVKPTSQSKFYSSSGKIHPINQANISTRMMGYVQTIHTHIGEQVSKGQLLITLNNTDLKAKIAQVDAGIIEAQAAFTNAEKDYKRYKELYKTESASLKELDDITTHYTMAKARLQGAKQMKHEVLSQTEYTNIRAPFSGVVSSKFINKGDLANPGMPLLSIEDNTTFDVFTMVSESEISAIEIGMPVDVLLKSNHKILQGKVKEISTSTLHSGSQYQIKIRLSTAEGLYSGMYTQVHFPISKSKTNKNLLLPISALVQFGQLQGVYVVSQQNTAVLRWLRLGNRMGNEIEVLSGLNPNDRYILSSESKLESGSTLTILK